MDKPKTILRFTSTTANPDFAIAKDVAVEEISELLNKSNQPRTTALAATADQAPPFVLVDVRMPEEFTGELGHIQGAKLIPLPVLAEQLATLPRDETVVFVCKSGGRSARATAFALSNGFEHVYNMKGGMLRWNDLRLPVQRSRN